MSSFIKKVFIIIILGFIVHLSFISVFPQLKAWSVSRQASENNNINTAFQRDLADSNSTQIIRPSADLLYGGCGYDVTYKPLIISTQLPSTYWSVSFFSQNTDNFATINELNESGENLKIYLFGPNSKPSKVSDGFIVVSPSNKGLMLMRQFIGNGSNFDELYDIQDTLECTLEGS